MYTTIAEILRECPPLHDAAVSKKQSCSANPIHRVEVAVDFSRRAEHHVLYILDLKADPADEFFIRFTDDCIQRRSAGILIPLQKQAADAACRQFETLKNSQKLPLIFLETKKSAADLATLITQCLYQLLTEQFRRVLDINTAFARMTLRNEGLLTMITCFKDILNNPVAVYDENFECIVATDPFLETWIRIRDTAQNFFLNNLYFRKQRVFIRTGARTEEHSLVYFPISFEKKVRAYLAVLESRRSLTEMDYLTLEICATAILTEMKHQLAIKSIEEKNINNFIYDLLHLQEVKKEALLREAETFGLTADSWYLCAVLEASAPDAAAEGKKQSTLLAESIRGHMFSFIARHLKEWNHHCVIGTLGKSIIAIFSMENARKEICCSLKKQCETLTAEFSRHYQPNALSVGIGNMTKGIHSIDTSYRNARIALNYGNVTCHDAPGFIVLYNDASILKLISSVGSSEALETLIPDSLRVLRRYDEDNNTELFETLAAYLSANCNARLASEKMFIHYKTMLYRLDKISELCHFDLSSNDERLDLTLGVKIMRIIQ